MAITPVAEGDNDVTTPRDINNKHSAAYVGIIATRGHSDTGNSPGSGLQAAAAATAAVFTPPRQQQACEGVHTSVKARVRTVEVSTVNVSS
jgi:hypothetical protein